MSSSEPEELVSSMLLGDCLLAILGFVLVGDGLRQAADPYSQMKR